MGVALQREGPEFHLARNLVRSTTQRQATVRARTRRWCRQDDISFPPILPGLAEGLLKAGQRNAGIKEFVCTQHMRSGYSRGVCTGGNGRFTPHLKPGQATSVEWKPRK